MGETEVYHLPNTTLITDPGSNHWRILKWVNESMVRKNIFAQSQGIIL